MVVEIRAEEVFTVVAGYLHRCPPESFPHPVNDSVLPKLASFIEAGMGHCWVAVGRDGLPDGVFFALFVEDLFTDDLVAQELFWHTLPGRRKGGAGMRLLRTFLAEAKRRKCRDVLVGYQMTDQNQFLEEIYRRMGFKLIAKGYKKVI